MSVLETVLRVLDRELYLQGRALEFTEDSLLRGSLPQLDSMAIVNLVAALEEQLGFEFPEEQLDGAIFESVGTLVACVDSLVCANQQS